MILSHLQANQRLFEGPGARSCISYWFQGFEVCMVTYMTQAFFHIQGIEERFQQFGGIFRYIFSKDEKKLRAAKRMHADGKSFVYKAVSFCCWHAVTR